MDDGRKEKRRAARQGAAEYITLLKYKDGVPHSPDLAQCFSGSVSVHIGTHLGATPNFKAYDKLQEIEKPDTQGRYRLRVRAHARAN